MLIRLFERIFGKSKVKPSPTKIDIVIEILSTLDAAKLKYSQSSDLSVFSIESRFVNIVELNAAIQKAIFLMQNAAQVPVYVYAGDKNTYLVSDYFQTKTKQYLDYESFGIQLFRNLILFLTIYQENQHEVEFDGIRDYNTRILSSTVDEIIQLTESLETWLQLV